MDSNMRKLILIISVLCGLCANAKVKLPSFFADGMVLQQQSECNIWGWAEPGKKVTIDTSWNQKSYLATARKDGRFDVKVKTPEAGGPYFIAFRDGDVVMLNSVMIGEVWLCSGQSNMEMQMKGYKGQPVEGAAEELLQCGDSLLRLFYAGHQTALEPQTDITGTWKSANTESVRNFSATAYFFGKALRQTLGVPVGLICTAYGGSACEAWMKAEWLKPFSTDHFQSSTFNLQSPITEADVKKLQQRCPTALYNGQLAPFIGYGIRGAIWYQGEDNVPRYEYYAPLLKAMVEGWRKEWKQGDFPFYYCQIAPFDYAGIDWAKYNSAFLREQQLKAEAMIPNARMAVLMDTGLKEVIHPRKKRQAGQRLALLALANTYGVKGLPDFATYSSVEFRNDTAVIAFDRSKEWVYFDHVVGDASKRCIVGDASKRCIVGDASKRCNCETTDACHAGNCDLPTFEIAGDDRVFHPAEAWASRNRVYVKSDKVKHPVAVRYAFHDWVVGDLMHDGLPVSSFRTDNW
jgi:sialate O-acetylesterase